MSHAYAAQTPLIELLRGVPKDAVNNYCHSTTESQHIPVGRLCNEAADRIAELEAKVRELESERDELLDLRKLLDDVKQGTMADERIKFVHNLITDLTASRQQVERLVEALNKWRNGRWMVLNPMKVYTAQEHCDAMRQEVVSGIDKALAAVEKERT